MPVGCTPQSTGLSYSSGTTISKRPAKRFNSAIAGQTEPIHNLLGSESGQGIDVCRAARRDIRRECRDDDEHRGDGDEHNRIERLDVVEQSCQIATARGSAEKSDSEPEDGQPGALAEHTPHDGD